MGAILENTYLFENSLTLDDESEILTSCRTGEVSYGVNNFKFEDSFSRYLGCQKSLAFNSFFSAVQVALLANNLTGEIIIPGVCNPDIIGAVLSCGLKPIFIDVDLNSKMINKDIINKNITSKTSAVVVNYFGGNIPEMEPILEICEKNKLILIEDCTEALGSSYKGKKVGTFGIGCFSFSMDSYLNLNNGAMLTTNSSILYDKIFDIVSDGFYKHKKSIKSIPYCLMSGFHALLGYQKMRRISTFLNRRQSIAKYFDSHTSEYNSLPYTCSGQNNGFDYYSYIIPSSLMDFCFHMSSFGIKVGMKKESIYRRSKLIPKLPYSDWINEHTTYFPIHDKISNKLASTIVNGFVDYFNNHFLNNKESSEYHDQFGL